MTSTPRTETAVDEFARTLRSQIFSGELAPGLPLREEALSEQYGLGRHTVRATLRALANERLVTIKAFHGARVRDLDEEEITQLMQLRTALESEAVRIARERIYQRVDGGESLSTATAAIMGNALAARDRLVELCETHPERLEEIDRIHSEFHQELVLAAGSSRIADVHAGLQSETQLFISRMRPLLGAAEMIRQHEHLIDDAVREGDSVIREHLADSASALISASRMPVRP